MRTDTLTMGIAGLTIAIAGCGLPGVFQPLDVVEAVELPRYTGKWYEIARYPNWFQGEDCDGTTAEYALREDGTIRVENRCSDVASGAEDVIIGSARVPDANESAKLKVRFFGPFEADYWIIDLDEVGYQWAVVGEPSRTFLWILSRTPTMDPDVYAGILSRLPRWGYDPGRLRVTLQPVE